MNIVLSNNLFIRFHLTELRDRSFIILKFIIGPIKEVVESKYKFYYGIKIILINAILRDGYLSTEDILDECLRFFKAEEFEYKIFFDFFSNLKEYAETGNSFNKISGSTEEH